MGAWDISRIYSDNIIRIYFLAATQDINIFPPARGNMGYIRDIILPTPAGDSAADNR